MDNSNQPYVFISYAHADSKMVLPTIKAMVDSGINIWYDNGIQAGSEWPEFIAEKVVSCRKFVLFISNAYLASQNCKRELNFAISRKKEILTIFLESVELSPGMEMQLGTYQAIYRGRFANDSAFEKSVSQEFFFNECKTGKVSSSASSDVSYAEPKVTDTASSEKSDYNPQIWNTYYQEQTTNTPKKKKSKTVAVLLAFFLGVLGAHRFYLGKIFTGILYLVFCWTGVTVYVAIVEALILLFTKEEKFDKKYNTVKNAV